MAAPTGLDIKTKISDMAVGDCIPCRYVATSGAAGAFSELGTCVAAEIPVAGTATPNGLFYFIKVAKGKLIADRVVQTSISWDVLNAAKYIQGNIVDFTLARAGSNGTAFASGYYVGYGPEKAFDNDFTINTGWFVEAIIGYIGFNFSSPQKIQSYSITARDSVNWAPTDSPKNWTFEGSNDGVNYTILHTVTNSIGWLAKTFRKFIIPSNKVGSYLFYRINISANNGCAFETSIGEIGMYGDSVLARSLTGGNAYLGLDGKASTTDKGLGAWPVNNEWDSHIVKSSLGGKITPGDNNVWHKGDMYPFSYHQEIPIPSAGAANRRVIRGPMDWYHDISSRVATSQGFRPVLQYPEDPKCTNVFY